MFLINIIIFYVSILSLHSNFYKEVGAPLLQLPRIVVYQMFLLKDIIYF